MREHARRLRESGRPQHRGPNQRMKARDLFADQVHPGPVRRHQRGIVGIAERGDVVDQRVEPHVEHAAARQRNAPVDRRARNRQIVEPAFERAHHFVVHATADARTRASL